MALPPIIERELRVALRKRRPARRRLQIAAMATGGAMLFLLFASLTADRKAGRNLHHLLCLAAGYFLLRTPMLTAGVFAEERRQQTLGLLFLSGLTAGEVFVSKFLSAALVACADLLAIFPVLALPFLLGGVSFNLFVATLCALPNLLVFALAVSLLASVLVRDDGVALIVAAVLVLLTCAVTPLIYVAQLHFSAGASGSVGWLRLSPAFAPYLVWNSFGAYPVREFWLNSAVTMVWSALGLGGAAWALKRLWREREEAAEQNGWLGRWHAVVHGDAGWRGRLAGRWLEANPFVWLSARDRQPAAVAWLTVGGIFAVWLLCFAAWPARWPSVPNFFLTATLLNLAVRWLTHYTAARTLGEARRDGTYELLLTTPLNPSDIVWGQLESLRWQFRPVGLAVLGLEVAMMVAGLATRSWTGSALAVYFMIWLVLLNWAWVQSRRWRGSLLSMWAGLNCGRPALAVWRSSGFNAWSWIWVFFNTRFLFGKLPRFPSGSLTEVVLVSLGLAFFVVTRFYQKREADPSGDERERRLMAEFREIAREPVPDPEDQRFKQWNVRERFPWGLGYVQQQLHERVVRRVGKN